MNKVVVETNGPVKTIWMNRPEKRNALDSEMLREMIDVLRAPVAAGDRVVVIRGKGNVFCAGLDMAERRETIGTGNASGIEVMLRAIELCPLPVVAVVQGDAIAGGNELALHCDLVLASETARFGMSLAQVGLVFGEKNDGGTGAGDYPGNAVTGRSPALHQAARAWPDRALRAG
jgi:enoyl-CoA hydratase/carnithine racemase